MEPADRDRIISFFLFPLIVICLGVGFVWADQHLFGLWISHHIRAFHLSPEGVRRSWLLTGLGYLVVLAMGIFFLPVIIPWFILRELFGINNFWSWLDSAPMLFIYLIYCGIFWIIFGARIWKAIGFWDPFKRTTGARPWSYRIFIYFHDWWERLRKYGRGSTGGVASLIEVFCWPYRDGGIFLGRAPFPRFSPFPLAFMRPIGIPTEKHMVTIAGTGSGKTTGALIPNLCIHKGSLLCIDPKGELARITARRRGHGGKGVRGMKQAVHVLDPFGIVPGWPSASYNVLDEMAQIAEENPTAPAAYAAKIAEALVKPAERGDPFWNDSARGLLEGLLLYVFTGQEERNLIKVRSLLMEGEEKGGFEGLLQKMASVQEGPFRHIIAGAAHSLLQAAPNTWGSILSTAREHTRFLDLPEIRAISTRSDFQLSDLKKSETSIYVCMPLDAMEGPGGRWMRMFVVLFNSMMIQVQKRPKRTVLLAIDEFPSLGRLEGMEQNAATMRSYGGRIWMVGQDLQQFERVYPGAAGSIIGNAEAVQVMGITETETIRHVARELGKHVVEEPGDRFGDVTRRMSVERPFLEEDQIKKILAKKHKYQMVLRAGERPMFLKIAPYYEYMPWWYYDRDTANRQKFNRWLWRWGGEKKARGEKKRGGLLEWLNRPLSKAVPARAVARTVDAVMSQAMQPPVMPRVDEAGVLAEVEQPENGAGLSDLNALIGLGPVKEQISKMVSVAALSQKRKAAGMPALSFSNHLVFTGNPGTGKTTVARIIGEIYREIGILQRGHTVECNREMLVGRYIGETAPKTKAVVERAMGGVLFIDEAYTLANAMTQDFGQEAIAQLLTMMESAREEMVVIVAGYREEMKNFIAANPGLSSRFKTTIEFPDYSPGEMAEIIIKMAGDVRCRFAPKALAALDRMLRGMKREKGFGNGREARNIFEACMHNQAQRLSEGEQWGKHDMAVIEAVDVPGDQTQMFTAVQLAELFVTAAVEVGYEVAPEVADKLIEIFAAKGSRSQDDARALFEAAIGKAGERRRIEVGDLEKRGRGRPRKKLA